MRSKLGIYLAFNLVVASAVTEVALAQHASGSIAFMRIGASARAIAMGRAYTAIAGDDALGLFWNPAACAYDEKSRIAITNRFFGESEFGMDGAMSFTAAGATFPLNWGVVVGVGAMYFGVNGIEQYDDRAVFKGDFSDQEWLAVASVARKEGPLTVGLNSKIIHQGFSGLADTDGETGASALGLDVGLIAHFWQPIRIGITLRDEVSMGNDRAPMTALGGLAYDRRIIVGDRSVQAIGSLDVEQIKSRPIRFHMGIALEQIQLFSGVSVDFRLGHSNRMLEERLSNFLTSEFRDQLRASDLVADNTQWGFGFGIKRSRLRIDYTFSVGMMHDPQYISLGYEY